MSALPTLDFSKAQPTVVNRIRIPLTRPYLTGRETVYVNDAIAQGHIGCDGKFDSLCTNLIETRYDVYKALMMSSCTAGLETAAMLLNLQPGDEVIMPSFTFVSTANAVVRAGGRPVFVDVRPETLNIDERLIEEAITPRTRSIWVVHYAGVGCNMDAIVKIARKHGLVVVEDAAHALSAKWNGKNLGSIGDLATFSFHRTKNYVCGEGGALCVNSPELLERAHLIRDKGTNSNEFARGKVKKYTWMSVGSAYGLNELSSAFLYAQLQSVDLINERRRGIVDFYRDHFWSLENEGLLRLPTVPAEAQTNYHLFHVLLPNGKVRDGMIDYLRGRGIQATFHYVPLHSSPMGLSLQTKPQSLPVTDAVSEQILRLPLYPGMTSDQVAEVCHYTEQGLRKLGVHFS